MKWPWARKRRYLSAEDAPVLGRIWDNEDDAIYDEVPDDEKEVEEALRRLSLEALEGEW